MYEEVCEAAQPTYGGGRGGHGGASGGYGAAKAPACRQVLVDLMVTYSQFTILLRFAFPLLYCFVPQVPRQECKNVPKQVCTNVPQQVCNSVPRQKCRNVPTKKCDNVPRQVLVNDDREDVSVGNSGGFSNSWHSENMFCSQVAREDCQTVPVQKCDSVKDEQCRNVPRQVLRGRN